MLTDFRTSFTSKHGSEFLSNTELNVPPHQMHHFSTLWNSYAQKSLCFRAEWRELQCKTQPFETVAEKYLSTNACTILFADKKILTVVTPKNPKNYQLYAPVAAKKKDVSTKCLRTWWTGDAEFAGVENAGVEIVAP